MNIPFVIDNQQYLMADALNELLAAAVTGAFTLNVAPAPLLGHHQKGRRT